MDHREVSVETVPTVWAIFGLGVRLFLLQEEKDERITIKVRM